MKLNNNFISYWNEQTKILDKIVKYILIFNPLETYSSIIGKLYNSFFPSGKIIYIKWVISLFLPYKEKNGHLIYYIKNIFNMYSLNIFSNLIYILKNEKHKCPYYELYICKS